ncbi:MAG: RND family transporter, partial [Bradymonadaceae bacterium]
VEVSLRSDREGRFKDPEVYRALYHFQNVAATESPVLSTQSIADFVQSARAALLGDPEQRQKMPDNRAQIQQLYLLIAGSPDAETGPNQYITRDFSHARVLLRVADVGARRQLQLAEDLRQKLEESFGQFDDITYRITGDAYVASVALDSFIRDLIYSLIFAAVVIFVLMALMFRSVRLGLISMIPNITPLVITLGYMGLQKIDLNSTTVIIFAIGLGIAVDDTIHVLARFREEMRARDADVREALLQTYFGAGRAIVMTSLLLLVGLAVLLFSNFIPTRQFGTLTSITIAAAILGDLVLLPPLLLLMYRDGETEAM